VVGVVDTTELYGIESADAVKLFMDVIAEASGSTIEARQSGPEQPTHRFKPFILRPRRVDELRARTHRVESVVQKRHRIVGERGCSLEMRVIVIVLPFSAEQGHQRNRGRRRTHSEKIERAVKRTRPCPRQPDAEDLRICHAFV